MAPTARPLLKVTDAPDGVLPPAEPVLLLELLLPPSEVLPPPGEMEVLLPPIRVRGVLESAFPPMTGALVLDEESLRPPAVPVLLPLCPALPMLVDSFPVVPPVEGFATGRSSGR